MTKVFRSVAAKTQAKSCCAGKDEADQCDVCFIRSLVALAEANPPTPTTTPTTASDKSAPPPPSLRDAIKARDDREAAAKRPTKTGDSSVIAAEIMKRQAQERADAQFGK